MFQFHLKPHRLESKILIGNPMGNSTERISYCLTPPSDDALVAVPGRKLVFYMLDGYFGNGASMISEPGAIGSSLPADLFNMQSLQQFPQAYFVFPDASTRIGGSQYVNSAACGDFANHIVHELIPATEANLNLEKVFRVVAGHSSGGFGALYLAAHFPGTFDACIASAADSLFDYSLRPSFSVAANRLAKAGGIDAFIAEFFAKPAPEKCSHADFTTLMILAMGSCYSPEPGLNSVHTRLPFDLKTLALDQNTWQKWLSFDPVNWETDTLNNLGQLKYLHLDCGDQDEYCAHFGHRILSHKLRELGIAHTLTEFAGGHHSTRYRYKDRLTQFAQFLKNVTY